MTRSRISTSRATSGRCSIRTSTRSSSAARITRFCIRPSRALAVRDLLQDADLAAPEDQNGALQVALTDASDRFLPVVERALGLQVGDVQLRRVQGVALAHAG